jgi:ABC-type sugar transport system ATPase subunit
MPPSIETPSTTTEATPLLTPEGFRRLELVEALGNEAFVYSSLGRYNLTARVAPRPFPDLGSPITLAFDLAKSHFFDRSNGERIGRG